MTDNRNDLAKALRCLNEASAYLLPMLEREPTRPVPPPVRPPVEPDPPPARPPPVEPPKDKFDVFSLRSMDPGRTVPWKSGDSADSMTLIAPGPHDIGDIRILGSTRSGLKTPSGSDHIRGVLISDCELTAGKPMPDSAGCQWLARCFGVNDWDMERCWFHDSNHKNEGHGFYGNVTGELTIRDSLFENLGGNAVQLVWNYGKRDHEGPSTEGGLVLLENIAIRNVSFNPARGSFAIAIYGGDSEKHDFVLRSLDLDLEWSAAQIRSGRTCFSAGGINLRGYGDYKWEIGKITLENCRVKMKNPHQALAQLGSCRELVVRNCEWIGGKVDVDHDGKKPCGSISWSGNTGDAVVRNQRGEWRPVSEDWGA